MSAHLPPMLMVPLENLGCDSQYNRRAELYAAKIGQGRRRRNAAGQAGGDGRIRRVPFLDVYDVTGRVNLPFVHSCGDSFGAIHFDVNSHLRAEPTRGQTTPWLYPYNEVGDPKERRHDRKATDGWGWDGNHAIYQPPRPPGITEYDSEQLLSSTLFLAYRSLGGDAADPRRRELAGDLVLHLVFLTFGSYSYDIRPLTAFVFATDLDTTDRNLPLRHRSGLVHVGGVNHKVVRWAFEKLNLAFDGQGTLNPGAPPMVDLYIRDVPASPAVEGEYEYISVHWESPDIWNRRAPDGQLTHENPVAGAPNYVYVRVRNRGTEVALAVNAAVRVFFSPPGVGYVWPDSFVATSPLSLNPPVALQPGRTNEAIVGPFLWTPPIEGHGCLLAYVDYVDSVNESKSDRANAVTALKDPQRPVPPPTLPDVGPIPDWRLVPADNNVAQKNVTIVHGGSADLPDDFDHLSFNVYNAFTDSRQFVLQPVLPGFMVQLGWTMVFTNAEGGSFVQAPDASTKITMQVIGGQPFTPAQLPPNPEDRTIRIFVAADGLAIGGMSYVLDPNL